MRRNQLAATMLAATLAAACNRNESVMTDTTATQPSPSQTTATTASVPPPSEPTATFAPPTAPPAGAETPDQRASVPRVSIEDARGWLNRSAVTFIDVRTAEAYAAGHIPGALNIPFARVEGEIPFLPKGKPIVAYCA